MQEVEVKALPLERLASILTPERAERLAECAARARLAFGNRTIWHVNATAHGGGVAEMLQTLLAYGRGAQIENRWLVLDLDRSSGRCRHHAAVLGDDPRTASGRRRS